MFVEFLIVVRGNVAARKLRFDPLQEARINGHHVFVMAVLRTILDHPDLSIPLDDLCFDLADLFIHQVAPVLPAVKDRLPRFLYAVRA